MANAQNPIRVEQKNNQPTPYLLVRNNLEALIHRNIYYQLIEWAVPSLVNDQIIGVWSEGVFFELGFI